MQRFGKRYLGALALVVAAMAAYHVVVVPIVEPPGRETPPVPVYQSVVATDRWWEQFFEPGSWQTDSPSLLQNSRGILLAKSWQQTGPKTLDLQQLTIMVPQAEDKGSAKPSRRTVWIISADEGAKIHFEKSFDANSEPIPSLESGELTGPIFITRKTLGGDDDATPWTLKTRDLRIDRGRVTTNSQVEIRWEDSLILGRELRIDLLGDLFSSATKTSSRWGPLSKMELYRVERVDMAMPNGGMWASMSDSMLPDGGKLKELPARMRVFCNGRFAFDFRRSIASLTNGVQVHQLLGTGHRDEFACQQLNATFASSDELPSGSDHPKGIALGDLYLQVLEAVGADQLKDFYGEKKVEIKAPSINAFVSAKYMLADLVDQRVTLDGQLATPGATQSMVRLRYGLYEFWAPKIAYDANGKENLAKVEHLGVLAAEGPGELNIDPSHKMGAMHVRWDQSLQMVPTSDSLQQKIALIGKTLVNSQTYGLVTSDQISIWLRKLPGRERAETADEKRTLDYRPEHIHATGNVAIQANGLHANINSMQIGLVFIDMPDAGDDPRSDTDGLDLRSSEGHAMYQWVGPPSQDDRGPMAMGLGGINPATNSVTNQPPPPVQLTGDSLVSKLVLAGKQTWIDELNIAGPVTISRATEDNPALAAWQVLGDQLSLGSDPDQNVNMQITGLPARVVASGGSLEGPVIRFDQRRNLVWMDKPGQFTLPMESKPSTQLTSTPATSNGLAGVSKVEWVTNPVCSWQGGMFFDGKSVHLKDKVAFSGWMRGDDKTLWSIESDSSEMHIHLAGQGLDMKNPKPTDLEVSLLELAGDVGIHALQVDQLRNELNYEHISVPLLSFFTNQNKIVGKGPGSIHSWNKNTKKETERNVTEAPFTGSHLEFRDQMVGFLDRNEVVFDGKVEIATGPLQSLEQTIDLNRLERLSFGQALIACDQLRVYETSQLGSTISLGQPLDQTWNYQARGAVTFEGLDDSGYYEGSGYELIYSQAKSQLILRGDGRRDAVIQMNPSSGVGPTTVSVQDARLNPRTLDLQIILGSGGVGTTFGGSQARGSLPVQPGVPISGQDATPSASPRDAVRGFFQNKR